MNTAQEITYAQIQVGLIIIIDWKGYKTPVKITRQTASNSWFKPLKFKGLSYENEIQHAHYGATHEVNTDEERLSKVHKYKDLFGRSMVKEPAKFYIIPTNGDFIHKADTKMWREYQPIEAPQQPPNA